jgi:methylamine dehydrogenase accessory protein MauD
MVPEVSVEWLPTYSRHRVAWHRHEQDVSVVVDGWWAASYVVLWMLVIALAAVVIALARQIGTLHMRLGPRGALEMDDEGPPLGEAPAPFETVAADGAPVTIGGPGGGQLIMFVSPSCNMCRDVLPALSVTASAAGLKPFVVSDSEDSASDLDPRRLKAPVVADLRLPQRYEIPGTPYIVVTDSMGVVRAKGTVNNLEQLEGLVDTAARRANLHPNAEVSE